MALAVIQLKQVIICWGPVFWSIQLWEARECLGVSTLCVTVIMQVACQAKLVSLKKPKRSQLLLGANNL